MKFAIIKERKNPPDRRVVLTPKACKKLKESFPEMELVIETSDIRTFKDQEYSDLNLDVKDDISEAEVLLGVKEVPIERLNTK